MTMLKVGEKFPGCDIKRASQRRRSSMKRGLLFLLATTIGGCSSSSAPYQDLGVDSGTGTSYHPTFTVAQDVPPCSSAAASATGSATVTIDEAGTMIAVTDFTYGGLSGSAMMAHIHSGGAGATGPAVFNFGSNLDKPINKTFTASDYPASPPSGAPATFAAFIAAVKAGQAYINVHTAACGMGEIRAQIQ
jgi:hypothetical protein